jgi:hypothetical protein
MLATFQLIIWQTKSVIFWDIKPRSPFTGPPLWSSGQSSWLQIRRPWFDSRHYQIFWGAGGEENTSRSGTGSTQPRDYSGFLIENREYGRRDPSRWPRRTIYPRKLAITSLISGGRSVGIVRSRTQAKEFSLVFLAHLQSSEEHVSTPSKSKSRPGRRVAWNK